MQDIVPVIIAPESPGSETVQVPVVKVFDGDGFLTKIKKSDVTGNPIDFMELEFSIRLGFIDAPELGQPGGQEAKDFLTSLIGDRWVDLVVLTKMDTGGIFDRHGRMVCVPYLTHEYSAAKFKDASSEIHCATTFGSTLAVTRNVELEMVLNGWAWVLERYGPDERYLMALEDAQRHKRGIWACENNVHPWDFKQRKYQKKRPSSTPDLFAQDHCPLEGCDGHLVKRQGKFGPFIGCSNFPRCRYSCSITE